MARLGLDRGARARRSPRGFRVAARAGVGKASTRNHACDANRFRIVFARTSHMHARTSGATSVMDISSLGVVEDTSVQLCIYLLLETSSIVCLLTLGAPKINTFEFFLFGFATNVSPYSFIKKVSMYCYKYNFSTFIIM